MLSVPLCLRAPTIFLLSLIIFLNARQYALTWFIVEPYAWFPGLSSIITNSSGVIHISSINPLIPYSGEITNISLVTVFSVFENSSTSSKVAGVALS